MYIYIYNKHPLTTNNCDIYIYIYTQVFNHWGMGLVQPKHTLPTLQLACILLAVINGLGGFRPRLLWGAPDFSPQNFGSVEAVGLAVGTADPCLFQVRQ